MTETEYFLTIFGMGLVTYIPRWIPLYFLSGKKLPRWFIDWLDLIPASIISALLIPALLVESETKRIDISRPELLVAIPTFLFALKTKSLGGTAVFGMFLYWLSGFIF